MNKKIGSLVGERLGKYLILELSSLETSQALYKGLDPETKSPLRIRILAPQIIDTPERKNIFKVHLAAAAKLSHPNIAALYDVDEGSGMPFIVTEHFEGLNLASGLQSGIRFTIPQILSLLIQVSGGLEYAHRHDVVHGGIRPSHLMITPSGVLKILEFGITPMRAECRPVPTEINPDFSSYLSPEQVQGRQPTARSDQFSLGVIAYELVAGVNPYASDNEARTASNLLAYQPPPPEQAGHSGTPVLSALIMKALEKKPEKRHETIGMFQNHLQNALAVHSPEERQISLTPASLCRPVKPETDPIEQIRAWIKELRLDEASQAMEFLGADANLQGKAEALRLEMEAARCQKEVLEWLHSAESSVRKGDFNLALGFYRRALQADPDNVKALTGTQRIRRRQRDEIRQRQVQPLMAEAVQAASQGAEGKAAEICRQVLDLDPDFEGAYTLLGELEKQLLLKTRVKNWTSEIAGLVKQGELIKAFEKYALQEGSFPASQEIDASRQLLFKAFWNMVLTRSKAVQGLAGSEAYRVWLEEIFSQESLVAFFTSTRYRQERQELGKNVERLVVEWMEERRFNTVRALLDVVLPLFPQHEVLISNLEEAKIRGKQEHVARQDRITQGTTEGAKQPSVAAQTRSHSESSSSPIPATTSPAPAEWNLVLPIHGTSEERVTACLRQISKRPDFPAISRHIREVLSVLGDEEKSLRTLTNIILKDYSLTVRILRSANSIHYNRTGQPILSVSQAVLLLGTEVIRQLTTGLIMLDHFQRRSSGLKELMLLALLTANHARQAAINICFPQPEEAYLCALFRNLGEVIFACFMNQDYSRILRKTKEENKTVTRACQEIAGFTYEDLGRAVVRHWNVSEKVNQCMQSYDAQAFRGTRTETELLRALVAFGHELTGLVYRKTGGDAKEALNKLIERFNRVLPMKKDDIRELLETAIVETRETFAILKVPLDELQLQHQCEAAVEMVKNPVDHPEEKMLFDPIASADQLMELLIHEIEVLLRKPEKTELHVILLTILEAVTRACGFDRAVLCLVNPERTILQARLGLGPGIDDLIEEFSFPLSTQSGRIMAAILSKQDVLLPEAHPSDIISRIVVKHAARGFGFFSLQRNEVLLGCLYVDWMEPRSAPDPKQLQGLSRLRDLMVQAIVRKKSGE